MNILGIETSCDETAAAVVKNGRTVLSNIVVSSLKDHAAYGGIIPELASRRQLEFIQTIVAQSLREARLPLKQIDAVAVTVSPGLIGSLLVGIAFARALSFALKKPLIEVDHIQAHLYANFLSSRSVRLPAVGLVVSGGHTSLYQISDVWHFKLLGQTLDDAVGEAYDKVARILGLGFPGGPAIDRLAQQGRKSHLRFTCAPLPDTLNFSFSGIKTAVLYYQKKHRNDKHFSLPHIAYAFQESIVSLLAAKCLSACQKLKAKILLMGGGVAANSALRHHLTAAAKKAGIQVFFPPRVLCTDNAAMIAGLGYHYR